MRTNTAVKDGARAFAAVALGSFPGFVFPFVVSMSLQPRQADTLLLVVAAAQLLTQVVGSTAETYVVAEAGRLVLRDRCIERLSILKTKARVSAYGAVLVLTVMPGLLLAYLFVGNGAIHRDSVAEVAVAIFAYPIVTAFASVVSGVLIAAGDYTAPLALQSMRTLLPAILAALQMPIWVIAVGFSVGELFRALFLERRLARSGILVDEEDRAMQVPRFSQLFHQSLSMFTSTLNPVVDRFFLLSVPGAIAIYELADRIFFAVAYALNSGFILPIVRRWPAIVGAPIAEIRAVLSKGGRVLSVVCLLVSLSAMTMLLAIHASEIIRSGTLSSGMLWAAILMPTVVLTMINTCGSRLVVLSRASWVLPIMATSDLLVNLLADSVLTYLYGPIGVPVATVILRVWVSVSYIVIVARYVVPRLSNNGVA